MFHNSVSTQLDLKLVGVSTIVLLKVILVGLAVRDMTAGANFACITMQQMVAATLSQEFLLPIHYKFLNDSILFSILWGKVGTKNFFPSKLSYIRGSQGETKRYYIYFI